VQQQKSRHAEKRHTHHGEPLRTRRKIRQVDGDHLAGIIRHQRVEEENLDLRHQLVEHRKSREHRQGDGQQRHQGEQRGIGEARRRLRAAVAVETPRHETGETQISGKFPRQRSHAMRASRKNESPQDTPRWR
jgi:hypothetical protein